MNVIQLRARARQGELIRNTYVILLRTRLGKLFFRAKVACACCRTVLHDDIRPHCVPHHGVYSAFVREVCLCVRSVNSNIIRVRVRVRLILIYV